jgi:hypothetical protein
LKKCNAVLVPVLAVSGLHTSAQLSINVRLGRNFEFLHQKKNSGYRDCVNGATTLSIMTLNVMTFSITTLTINTFSITTFNITINPI